MINLYKPLIALFCIIKCYAVRFNDQDSAVLEVTRIVGFDMAPLNAPFLDTLADPEIKYSEMNRVYEFKPIDGVESVLPYLREGVRRNLDPDSGLPIQFAGLSICCLVFTENPRRRRCYMANAVNHRGELIFE